MSERIVCIFCDTESESTVEHVVPEFAGGALLIKDVCKPCNDRMESDFEGPISRSVIFRLPRYIHGIRGKSRSPIRAFPGTGTTEHGKKATIDSEYKPHITTQVEEQRLESGRVKVNLKVDASDKELIPRIIEAKIRRTAKSESPDMSPAEVDELVEKSLVSLPRDFEVQRTNPTIRYDETIDLNQLSLLMMKIAYEMAYHHHGGEVKTDDYFLQLRESIKKRDSNSKTAGTLLPEPDPFSFIPSPNNTHCVILYGNMCYIRLFNLSAIIKVIEEASSFSLPEDKWIVYWFDFVNETYDKHILLDYIYNIGTPQ